MRYWRHTCLCTFILPWALTWGATDPHITPMGPLIPSPPQLSAQAYLLMDANSGRVLAHKAADTSVEPASLTKLMSLYIISNALQNKLIHLNDRVLISSHAWQEKGSRMFIRAGEKIPVQTLIQGVIVASGNDATMALAEHVAGSDTGFVSLMNIAAQQLHLQHSHFKNPTGLPGPGHTSSAQDLATIAQQLITRFPTLYAGYRQKWFSYNHIRQPNRNRLLWLDPSVDGLKTGHTSTAGYCLVASAQRQKMRLISVVLGAHSDAERNAASQQLLNYGFRFFHTVKLFNPKQQITTLRTWKGAKNSTPIGVQTSVYVTIPRGYQSHISVEKHTPSSVIAPILIGQKLGTLAIKFNHHPLTEIPLVALSATLPGNRLHNMLDTLRRWVFG